MQTCRASLPVLLAALLLSSGPLHAAGASSITFSPAVWIFGAIAQGARVQMTVEAANHSRAPATVTFVSTCSCLTVEPETRVIAAGGTASFVLGYDSTDDTGNTVKAYIVRTDLPGEPRLSYILRGTVRAEHPASAPNGAWTRQDSTATTAAQAAEMPRSTVAAEMPRSTVAAEMPRSTVAAEMPRSTVAARMPRSTVAARMPRSTVAAVSYYYTPGCRSCEEFLSIEVPRLEKKLGIRIDVKRKDVLDPVLYGELSSFASSQGQSLRAIPALRIGTTLLQGDQEIRARFAPALTASVPGTAPPAAAVPPAAAAVPLSDRLAVLPVVAAGLIDGINPCAFTTLIFLLASLALAGRGRGDVLAIGLVFSFAVFLTYLGIGLGLFAALRAASAVAIVSVLLRWVLVGVLLVCAALSVYDFALIRKGRPTEILLQLPSALKKRIHASIRTRVRTAALVGSSFVLGFLVSVFEFACTGQIYLPTLGVLARVHRQLDAFGLLVLYNLCFIVPLLVVFGGHYYGMSSARITTLFQAHMGWVKLGLAAVFAGLAVFTLVG